MIKELYNQPMNAILPSRVKVEKYDNDIGGILC